jgi:hypothetical protein
MVLRHPLAGIGHRPPELHKGNINIDTASFSTAAAIDADIILDRREGDRRTRQGIYFTMASNTGCTSIPARVRLEADGTPSASRSLADGALIQVAGAEGCRHRPLAALLPF